ncbi:MAG TPA: hemerythrin domain-containing protein [Planctomycetota bacterium]|nr:hemerythrin domain-containing protein [Planctomycetota bacterium]
MTAIDVVRADHREFRRLLLRAGTARRRSQRLLLERLGRRLWSHLGCEEELLYPAAQRSPGRTTPLLERALDSNAALYRRIPRRRAGDLREAIAGLREGLEAHIRIVEGRVLREVRRRVSRRGLRTLAGRMAKRLAFAFDELS